MTTNEPITNDQINDSTMVFIQLEKNNPRIKIKINFLIFAKVSNDVVEDDLIALGELTEYPTFQWKFPQITSCPRSHCKEKYSNRDAAIAHYRDVHAKYDVLCNDCNSIVSVSSSHNLIHHYKRKHPNIEPPMKTKLNQVLPFDTYPNCYKLFKIFSINFPDCLHDLRQKAIILPAKNPYEYYTLRQS